MIVYNVKRRWFDRKSEAEQYRIAEKLPRGATLKIGIRDRVQLAALLNALCEPPLPGVAPATEAEWVPASVMDDAFVDPDLDIPKFLRDSQARLLAGKGD